MRQKSGSSNIIWLSRCSKYGATCDLCRRWWPLHLFLRLHTGFEKKPTTAHRCQKSRVTIHLQLPSHREGPQSVSMATWERCALILAVFDFTVRPVPLYVRSHPDIEAERGGGGAKCQIDMKEQEKREEMFQFSFSFSFSVLNLIIMCPICSETSKSIILRLLVLDLSLKWTRGTEVLQRFSKIETRYC